MSVSFNVFRLIFSVLSVVEQVTLFVTIGKALRKQDAEKRTEQVKHVVENAVDKASAGRDQVVTGGNLLESTMKVAAKSTVNRA